ncbi:hypothetical protein ABID58_007229 [Bradyrhizobium sp. S3.2.6]|uniref:hypothetical protein n=1 Tax=Bradyrhizobium sp. S3.2.6 TaxID=3156428 RepID=UPI00339A41AE
MIVEQLDDPPRERQISHASPITARRIQATFLNAPPKHKDNVSRYFNQDFYAYYEIAGEQSDAKRRYRLSNTGYGMAIRSLRTLLRASQNLSRPAEPL